MNDDVIELIAAARLPDTWQETASRLVVQGLVSLITELDATGEVSPAHKARESALVALWRTLPDGVRVRAESTDAHARIVARYTTALDTDADTEVQL